MLGILPQERSIVLFCIAVITICIAILTTKDYIIF